MSDFWHNATLAVGFLALLLYIGLIFSVLGGLAYLLWQVAFWIGG